MPVWKIPRSYCSVTGVVASNKAIGEPRFQSTLERDLLTLLDFDPSVASYETQPVEIHYQDAAGQHRRYRPDILILYASGSMQPPILGEVKYVADLKRADLRDQHRRMCRAGRDYAEGRGWRFSVFTERVIRTPLLDNARFLLPYTRLSPGSAIEEQLHEVLEHWRPTHGTSDDGARGELGRPPSVSELLTRITSSDQEFLEALPVLWRMVGTGRLHRQPNQVRVSRSSKVGAVDVRSHRCSDARPRIRSLRSFPRES